MRKLIFLRNGNNEYNELYKNKFPVNELVDLDSIIQVFGFKHLVNNFPKDYKFFITTYPAVLSINVVDEKYNSIWWNEEEHKWEIYFVENGKLKPINEYTNRELRQAHNIENLYLNGGLDE